MDTVDTVVVAVALTPRQLQAELMAELGTLSVGRPVNVEQASSDRKFRSISIWRRPTGDAVAVTVVLVVEVTTSVSVLTTLVNTTSVLAEVMVSVVVATAAAATGVLVAVWTVLVAK